MAIRHRKPVALALVLGLAATVVLLTWTVHYMRTEALAWFALDTIERDCAVYLQQVGQTI